MWPLPRVSFWSSLAAILLSACGNGDRTITVGSKNFSENLFLGELMAQQIEAETGLTVDRKLNLGGTFLCHEALLAGELDLYPEYTGTALTAILNQPVQSDPGAVYDLVSGVYGREFQVEWRKPFGFNNTFAILVRNGPPLSKLTSITELAKEASKHTIAFGFEFLDRDDGYRGMVEAYGMRFASEPRTMDMNLVYHALRDEQVDVAVGNSTDGLISAFNLRILNDDRGYFPPYDAAPLVRADTLTRHPAVGDALDGLAGLLSEAEMQRINYQLDGEHRPAAEVAREVRLQKGLESRTVRLPQQ